MEPNPRVRCHTESVEPGTPEKLSRPQKRRRRLQVLAAAHASEFIGTSNVEIRETSNSKHGEHLDIDRKLDLILSLLKSQQRHNAETQDSAEERRLEELKDLFRESCEAWGLTCAAWESVGAPPQQPQQQQHMPLNPEAAPFEPAENETKEKEDSSAEGRELEKMRDMYERLADEAARTKERLSKLQDSLSRAGLEEFLDPEASEYAGPAGPDGNYVRCLKCRSVRHQDDMTFCYGCTAAIHTDCCKEEWKTYGPGQWCEACYDPDWDASSESSKSSESSDGRVDALTFQVVASQRDSLEKELKELRAERDSLKRELMVLRAELGGQGKKYTREEVDAVMEPLLQQAVQQAVDEMARQMADQKKYYEACIERYERALAVLNPH